MHLPFADPYCPTLSRALADAEGVRRGGTMVVVEGPRFSTRAESRHYAAQGWSLINMTGHPEAVLARELRMCYSAVALVTDMDAGAESGDGVGQAEVFAMFAANIDRVKAILAGVVGRLPEPGAGECACASWADGMELPYEIPGGSARIPLTGSAGRPGRPSGRVGVSLVDRTPVRAIVEAYGYVDGMHGGFPQVATSGSRTVGGPL